MGVRGDFLVIGSGIAGLRAAISLAETGDVVMLTKADPRESNTGYAQGGIAAAIGPDDSPELHFADTIAAGDGLCVPEAVKVLVTDGPRYVNELIAWGVAFDRDSAGAPALGREAAHSVRRVLHARDTPGREIGRVLWQKVQSHPRVRVFDDALAMSLLMHDGECRGAAFIGRDGTLEQVDATRTLIATGGAGQVFRETTNPAIATGDGIAMAFEAGARVTDLEFIQFHPTALSVEGAPRFLISEALRGEGARLVNADGERFVHRYEPAGDLASRDLVARAIVREVERTNAPVYLSMAHLDHDYVRRRFPAITDACQAGRARSGHGQDSGEPGCALCDGRHRDRSRWAHVDRGSLCRGRSCLHGCSWSQSSGEQFAARRARVRSARGGRHDRSAQTCTLLRRARSTDAASEP